MIKKKTEGDEVGGEFVGVAVDLLKRGTGRGDGIRIPWKGLEADGYHDLAAEVGLVVDNMYGCHEPEIRAAQAVFDALKARAELERLQDQLRTIDEGF